MKRILTLLLFAASIEQSGCNYNKDNVQSVTLQFDSFKSPYTSFSFDFTTHVLTCRNFGYDPKLDTKTNGMVPTFEKEYNIDAESSRRLRELFDTYMPDTLTRHIQHYDADGGGFEIDYVRQNKDTTKLFVENPIRNDKFKTDFEQIDELFRVAYSSVLDSIGINTIDETYEIYSADVPIRKLSEQPLTYKIWGNFSGCREDNRDLVNFLDSISKKPCVLIEIGNRKLSYCLTEVIAEYSLKENMHFLSADDLPFLWKEMNNLKKQVDYAKTHNITLADTPGNAVLLDIYLSDSTILNKWLSLDKEQLFGTKATTQQPCR
jgi:hypothetical protein